MPDRDQDRVLDRHVGALGASPERDPPVAGAEGPIENPIYVGVDHIQKLERDERKERVAALRAGAARHLAKRDLGNRSTAR